MPRNAGISQAQATLGNASSVRCRKINESGAIGRYPDPDSEPFVRITPFGKDFSVRRLICSACGADIPDRYRPDNDLLVSNGSIGLADSSQSAKKPFVCITRVMQLIHKGELIKSQL